VAVEHIFNPISRLTLVLNAGFSVPACTRTTIVSDGMGGFTVPVMVDISGPLCVDG
jgi:hypothetical protein